jgi:hypothetical protein
MRPTGLLGFFSHSVFFQIEGIMIQRIRNITLIELQVAGAMLLILLGFVLPAVHELVRTIAR